MQVARQIDWCLKSVIMCSHTMNCQQLIYVLYPRVAGRSTRRCSPLFMYAVSKDYLVNVFNIPCRLRMNESVAGCLVDRSEMEFTSRCYQASVTVCQLSNVRFRRRATVLVTARLCVRCATVNSILIYYYVLLCVQLRHHHRLQGINNIKIILYVLCTYVYYTCVCSVVRVEIRCIPRSFCAYTVVVLFMLWVQCSRCITRVYVHTHTRS